MVSPSLASVAVTGSPTAAPAGGVLLDVAGVALVFEDGGVVLLHVVDGDGDGYGVAFVHWGSVAVTVTA